MTQVLMVGDPFDGVTLHGPFDTHDEAADYGERRFTNDTWWVVPVTEPVQPAPALGNVTAPRHDPEWED